jgi:hypothetical protein
VPELSPAIRRVLQEHGVEGHQIGYTAGDRLTATHGGTAVLDVAVSDLSAAWLGAVPEAMA